MSRKSRVGSTPKDICTAALHFASAQRKSTCQQINIPARNQFSRALTRILTPCGFVQQQEGPCVLHQESCPFPSCHAINTQSVFVACLLPNVHPYWYHPKQKSTCRHTASFPTQNHLRCFLAAFGPRSPGPCRPNQPEWFRNTNRLHSTVAFVIAMFIMEGSRSVSCKSMGFNSGAVMIEYGSGV